jgi:hypothetical protein
MPKEVKAERDEVDKVGAALLALGETELDQMDREILIYIVGKLDGLLMREDAPDGSGSGPGAG